MAFNNLYQLHQRFRGITIRQCVMDPPSYTKVLSATPFRQTRHLSSRQRIFHRLTNRVASRAVPGVDYRSEALLPTAILVVRQKTPLIMVLGLRQYIKLLGSFPQVDPLTASLQGKEPL